MANLVVFTYENESGAAEALATVVAKKQENVEAPLLATNDAAVAVKRDDGKAKIRQTVESAAKGGSIFSGSLWGLLIGFIFGGPSLFAVLGGGNSALFLLKGESDPATIAEALGDHAGTLFHTTMSDDTAAALTEASSDAELSAAVEAEHAD